MENTKKETSYNSPVCEWAWDFIKRTAVVDMPDGSITFSVQQVIRALNEMDERLSSLPSTEERKTAEEIKHKLWDLIYTEIQLDYGSISGYDDAVDAVYSYFSQQTEAMAKEIESLKGQLAVSERFRLQDAASHNDEKYQDWERNKILKSQLSEAKKKIEQLWKDKKYLHDVRLKLESELSAMRERVEKQAYVLAEAKAQIEYLHGKFKKTGSGNAVLAMIQSLNPTKQD